MKHYYRQAGIFYFIIIICGIYSQIIVRESLIDFSNAELSAENILSNEDLYRSGFIAELLMLISDVIVTYSLFRIFHNNRGMKLSTLFRFLSICILSVVSITHFAGLVVLESSDLLAHFSRSQIAELSTLIVKFHGVGYNVSLMFFGAGLALTGFAILNVVTIRTISYLLILAGILYILNSIIWFQTPQFIKFVYPYVLLPCFIAELSFAIYLTFKKTGVSNISNGGLPVN